MMQDELYCFCLQGSEDRDGELKALSFWVSGLSSSFTNIDLWLFHGFSAAAEYITFSVINNTDNVT